MPSASLEVLLSIKKSSVRVLRSLQEVMATAIVGKLPEVAQFDARIAGTNRTGEGPSTPSASLALSSTRRKLSAASLP